MPPTQGLEYNRNSIRSLMLDPNVIGLVFEKQTVGFDHQRPFDISPLYFDTATFAFGKGTPTRLQVVKRWKDTAGNLEPDDADDLGTAGSYFAYTDLNYFNPAFELSVFFKEELETMIGTGNNIVISGMKYDFGMLTIMNSSPFPPTLDPANIFTLKAETTYVSPWPPSAFSAADNIGAASVVPGLPCPPYWVSVVGGGFIKAIYKRLISNIKEINGEIAKLIITGELENKIRRSWVEFLLKNEKQKKKEEDKKDKGKDKNQGKDELGGKQKHLVATKEVQPKSSRRSSGSNNGTSKKTSRRIVTK